MIKTRKLTLKQGHGLNYRSHSNLDSFLTGVLYVTEDPSQEPTLHLVTFSQSSFVFHDLDTFKEY